MGDTESRLMPGVGPGRKDSPVWAPEHAVGSPTGGHRFRRGKDSGRAGQWEHVESPELVWSDWSS